MQPYDIYLVGVGGQGVLTMSTLIARAASRQGIPVNLYPTKGMAQRGGFVKIQLRLGRKRVGPNIPEQGADLVLAMERSEALKAVRYIKPAGIFLLWGHVWQPTAVMLGRAAYPSLASVREHILATGAQLVYGHPAILPTFSGKPVAANVFVLGMAMGHTSLAQIIPSEVLLATIQDRWPRAAERNTFTFRAGIESQPEITRAGRRKITPELQANLTTVSD